MNLLRSAYVIADPDLLEASVMRDGAIVFDKGQIVEVGAWQELQKKYSGLTPLELPYNSLVIPGLVNAHHHGRGLSTTQIGMVDKPLELWLPSFILYPPLDPYLDTLYTALRMLKSGVTTSLLSHSDSGPLESYKYGVYRSLEAYRDAGVRIAFALGHYDQNFLTHVSDEDFFLKLPEPLAIRARHYFDPKSLYIVADDYFSFFDHLFHELKGAQRARLLLSPCGLHWASQGLQKRTANAAERYQTQVHFHALETPRQRDYAQKVFGKATARVLNENGLLGHHVSIAHGIHSTREDIELFAETKTTIVTNPSSNLRLGSGVLPLHLLRENSVKVALGIDSMGLFADDDMLSELALLQALHRKYDGKKLSPYEALQMATRQGAGATGFHSVGKLLAGYQADLVAIGLQRFQTPYIASDVDAVALALSQGKAEDVHTVLVAGDMLVREGKLVGHDLGELETQIQKELSQLTNIDELREKKKFLNELEPYLV
jgi:5-methylthioadenosine/S-adenosylhomocysteine deaminase